MWGVGDIFSDTPFDVESVASPSHTCTCLKEMVATTLWVGSAEGWTREEFQKILFSGEHELGFRLG